MMHYDVKGKGKSLFFIHGWGCNSRVWVNQVRPLSKKYRIITADLRGHGNSKWQNTDDLLGAFAQDIVKICEKLNIRDINFVGWSLGCYVIFKLIENAPEIINSVILIGASPKFLRGDGFSFGFRKKNLRLMRRRLNRDFNSALFDFRRSMFLEDEARRADFQNILKVLNDGPQPNREGLILGLEMLEKIDFRDEVKRFNVPALIVCGEGDFITPKQSSEYLHNAIKNSTLAIIKGAGHAPFLTKPQEFNLILEKWINER